MAFQIGDHIFHGRYRVEAVLGEDESGTIYQAWDTQLEIPVAIQERLEPATAGDPPTTPLAASTGLGNSKAFTIPGQGRYHVIDYIAGEDLAHLLVRFRHMSRSATLAAQRPAAAPVLENLPGEVTPPQTAAGLVVAAEAPMAAKAPVAAEASPTAGQADTPADSLVLASPPVVQIANLAPARPLRHRRRPLEPLQATLWGLAGLCILLLALGLFSLARTLATPSRPAAGLPNAAQSAALSTPAGAIVPISAGSTPATEAALPLTGLDETSAGAPALQPGLQATAAAVITPTLPAPTPAPTATLAAKLPAYTLVGRLAPPYPQSLRAVAEKDGYAYVLTRTGLLFTYDLTHLDPAHPPETAPAPLSQLQLANGGGLLRHGDALYAFGASGLEMLDLSQPQQPRLQYQQKDLEALNLFVSGNRMVALGRGIVIVYDISQPLQPILTGKLFTAPQEENFAGAIYQDMLYVSTYWSDTFKTKSLLRVYQIGSQEIREVQRIDTGELAYHLLILDDTLIRCTSRDVEAWELTRKDNPRFTSAAPAPARACLLDGENIVTAGAVFNLQLGQVRPIATFDPAPAAATGRFEAYPYGAAAGSGLLLLAQPDQVLVLTAK